jgi:hypothetical protein
MDTAYERSLWILQQNPENESGLAPRAAKVEEAAVRVVVARAKQP